MKEMIKAFRIVFGSKKYIFLCLAIAIVFFGINIYIPNFSLVFDAFKNFRLGYTFPLLGSLFLGGMGTMLLHTLLLLIAMSLLIGIVISMIVFRVKYVKTNNIGKKRTTLAIILGVAAPGCAACGIGLLPLIGLGGALVYLPFQGLEIGLVSLLLLFFAINSISKSISNGKLCKI
jgi:hypothetical protein